MLGILCPHCTPWHHLGLFSLLSEVVRPLFMKVIHILFSTRLKKGQKEMDIICSSDGVDEMTLLSVTHDAALKLKDAYVRTSHFNQLTTKRK